VPSDIRQCRLRARRRVASVTTPFPRWLAIPGNRGVQRSGLLHYDDGTREGRKLSRHKAWLETLRCPVLHLDGTLPVADLVDQVVRSLV
jgi:hypothetical protein